MGVPPEPKAGLYAKALQKRGHLDKLKSEWGLGMGGEEEALLRVRGWGEMREWQRTGAE